MAKTIPTIKNANFKVDPKLAELLGETYKSTEDATKELIDNAFDADASNVWIMLPDPLTPNAIITIADDGSGMKENEIRTEYLKIASSRFSRKGDKTVLKKRKVKGRKGIGKFSGLMVAAIMEVKSKVAGKETTLTISRDQLSKEKYDLEKVSLPITVAVCEKSEHGTQVTLLGLNQNFAFPNAEKLKQLLVWDYGRVSDFSIFVNNVKIGVQDFPGTTVVKTIAFEGGKTATLKYTITEKPIQHPGLIFRVGNKIVGRPENFLRDDLIIPDKLKRRVVGEIICDDLEDDVTADWGAIIENSNLYRAISDSVTIELKQSLDSVFKTEMHLAKLRYKQQINKELSKLPEYKRQFAEKSIQKILEKFYDESEEKVNTIISVMIDAIEKDYYWNVIQNIEKSKDGEIESFADALSHFGLVEMSVVTGQAINRLEFLNYLDILNQNPSTLESDIHKALEKNLWVLGFQYSLVFSNQTLVSALDKMLGLKFTGARAKKRPDLFLGEDIFNSHLLIEFKRPSIAVGRDAENQALKYRDDLNSVIHNKKINIFIIGGSVDPIISSHNESKDVRLLSYTQLISNARSQLGWLLKELKSVG